MSDPISPINATLELPQGEGPGGHIGAYKILHEIGEGGFGSVFEAEQEHPVRRRVALKIIKLGMDTREVIARFEAERQALALMDHPHIARVFDAGATSTGRPYFVMELVKGESITSYCMKRGLSIAQRLELFEQVCGAVQHAHTKSIIHRDLKPNNVLVSTHDDQPFAKVIDFGIAKATSGSLTDKTLYTEANLMMGTPLYMSPEQAEGSADIDTRTDIYALGVILYELLTDTTPLDSDSLRSAGYAEMQRIIREVEPMRPSARISRSAKVTIGKSANHRNEPNQRAKTLRGELDWIVMKAIEKDRTRRYETANALAMDIRRYLAGEAVLAAPPSALYRMQKFVRRNKTVVAAGALVAAALLVGIVGFAWQANVARAQARLAQQRADQLKQVSDFQAAMLEKIDPTVLGKLLSDDVHSKYKVALDKAALPVAARAHQLAAFESQWQYVNATDAATDLIDRTILKPAVTAIDKKFKEQPLVSAALRQALADSYVGIGLYDKAMPLQQSALAARRHALGSDNDETMSSMLSMGSLLEQQGKLDSAEPYFRAVLATRRRLQGEDNAGTTEAVAHVGALLVDQGKFDQAEPYLHEALEKRRRMFGENNPDTLNSISDVAGLLVSQGKLGEAEPYLREVAIKFRQINGEDDPDTLRAINNLGIALAMEGKSGEAEPFLREALQKHRRLLGENHPDTLQSLVALAGALREENKNAEAEPLLREAIAKSPRVLGEDNYNTVMSISLLGDLLDDQGRFAEAVALLAPSEENVRRGLSTDAPSQWGLYLLDLGKARAGSHDYAVAEAPLLEAHTIASSTHDFGDKRLRAYTKALVDLYLAWNKAEPGKGYDAKSTDWQKKLALMDETNATKAK